ncbi:MAG: hypothetical protein KF784_11750 [Fimbriimonadaceae bacterium]|nr:hypothetical protein [Fimbriimonadaceae bacterium]
MRPTNKLAEAFKESYNVVGLAGAFALSAALLNPLPFLAAIVLEAAYLMFVPDSRWFARRLEKKYDDEIVRHREELKAKVLPFVRDEVRDKFARLEDTRAQIEAQAKGEDRWFREALRKLDYLLEKFLQFAERESRFVTYLLSVLEEVRNDRRSDAPPIVEQSQKKRRIAAGQPQFQVTAPSRIIVPTEEWINRTTTTIRDHYKQEREALSAKIESGIDEPTKRVIQKRLEVLERRSDYVSKIGMILSNLHNQMELMSDAFGLINDEIRARSPEQVLADIDEVVLTTNSLTEAIEAVTPLEELVTRIGA